MTKDARVDVVLQRIEEKIGDEINAEPCHIKRYGVNNIFQRTFSYLVGWKDNGEPIKIKTTASGAIKIASIGSGLEHVEVETGTAAVAISGATELTHTASKIRIIAINHPLLIYTSSNKVGFEEPIFIKGEDDKMFDIICRAFKTMRYGLNDADYRIEAYR